ncbi:hypothetical protein AB0O76_00505 [Streptomyces sp. NPDC086554]|uniref:hypothetical protein n=1 Tax=Streptomyces sp. NPDC086554 TaxID=3154864 RepID=UPI00342B8A94
MTDIDFYVSAVTRNRVLDTPLGTPPEAWEAALGGDFLDDVHKKDMRRDYALVELAFIRSGGHWQSVTASIQVHRLARGIQGIVPAPLEQAYGPFAPRTRFDAFHDALREQGGNLEEVKDPSLGGFRYFRETTTRADIYVVDEPPSEEFEAGTLWSVILSQTDSP